MGKLTFCGPLWGRRGFLRGCVLLGVGGALFGVSSRVAHKPVVKPETEFVVINGWVLPSQYFRDGQA
ncbi:twin-arginine translocation signal domain-containing protein [Pseudomonas sp. Teo4]|uniref:twin-arginine translocation signal domain-containing protein n=1 Tax=Pseudomonas sp. Teo4 TaxID=3064528 RepID=UPI002ACB077E|nr:twin-arginine translocation signal domain-containing protein [Pseudomonas sp. Teo4]